jgi:hypothetical protein
LEPKNNIIVVVVDDPFLTSASNSSKIINAGFVARALSKTSRTFCSLAPIYFDNSSGPFTVITLNLDSYEIARAIKVFPHPVGPYNIAPPQIRSPHF